MQFWTFSHETLVSVLKKLQNKLQQDARVKGIVLNRIIMASRKGCQLTFGLQYKFGIVSSLAREWSVLYNVK
jgi:hypothetical protein